MEAGHTALTVAVADERVEEDQGGDEDEGGGEAVEAPPPPGGGLHPSPLLLRRCGRFPPQKRSPRPLHSFPSL